MKPRHALPPRIGALIYDFDDTIVESEHFNDSLFAEVLLRDHGVTLDAADTDALFGRSWKGIHLWLSRRYGLQCDRDELWAAYMRLKRERLRGSGLRVATGFDRMLDLPSRHVIVSGSTADELEAMFDAISLDPARFEFVLSDDDYLHGKPDPEGYLKALARLALPAAEVLVFEDSPAGIEAARRAGLTVAFVAELASRPSAAEKADMSFATFLDAWGAVKDRIGPPPPAS
ncbi:MAG TPA: HAD family phosphatase [Spirochaetia bacterium]